MAPSSIDERNVRKEDEKTGLFAHAAAVGTLARVGAHVRRHRRRLREAALADAAPERLLAAVRPHVRRQIGRLYFYYGRPQQTHFVVSC